MSRVRKLDPALVQVDYAAIERKVFATIVSGICCEGCDKPLSQAEQELKGYASGFELGLCWDCAADVNTPGAIARAQAEGHPIKGPVVLKARTNTGVTFTTDDQDG